MCLGSWVGVSGGWLRLDMLLKSLDELVTISSGSMCLSLIHRSSTSSSVWVRDSIWDSCLAWLFFLSVGVIDGCCCIRSSCGSSLSGGLTILSWFYCRMLRGSSTFILFDLSFFPILSRIFICNFFFLITCCSSYQNFLPFFFLGAGSRGSSGVSRMT